MKKYKAFERKFKVGDVVVRNHKENCDYGCCVFNGKKLTYIVIGYTYCYNYTAQGRRITWL